MNRSEITIQKNENTKSAINNSAMQSHAPSSFSTLARSPLVQASSTISNLTKPIIQPKLRIGAPNDKYEQEADRVAEQIFRMPEPQYSPISIEPPPTSSNYAKNGVIQRTCASCTKEYRDAYQENRPVISSNLCPNCRVQTKPLMSLNTPLVQRQESEKEDEETIQSKATAHMPTLTLHIASGIQSLQGGGQPLPESSRSFFEPRFGHDFSRVRIHTHSRAVNMARSINARAFTLGQNVVFGSGQYQPDQQNGQRLLAHELTHVIQQTGRTGIPLVQRACDRAIRAPESCTAVGGDIFDISGNSDELFLSERACDHFFPVEETRLARLARERLSVWDSVDIHGFASEEGDPTFNDALSCARANTAARVIRDSVGFSPSPNLSLFKHGATPGERTSRRSAVVLWPTPSPETPAPEAPTTPSPATLTNRHACFNGSYVSVSKESRTHTCPAITHTTQTPPGRYCIRPQGEAQHSGVVRRITGTSHHNWYLLEPQFTTTRSRMHLHPGSRSLGCVTVTNSTCFDRIASILNQGGTDSGFGYDGYPPGNSEGATNPRSSVNCVGWLDVSYTSGTCPDYRASGSRREE